MRKKQKDIEGDLMFLYRQIELGIYIYEKTKDKKLGNNLVRLINEYRERKKHSR